MHFFQRLFMVSSHFFQRVLGAPPLFLPFMECEIFSVSGIIVCFWISFGESWNSY